MTKGHCKTSEIEPGRGGGGAGLRGLNKLLCRSAERPMRVICQANLQSPLPFPGILIYVSSTVVGRDSRNGRI